MSAERRPHPDLFRFINEVSIIAQLSRTRLEQVLPHNLKLAQFSVLNHFVRLREDSSPARLASAFQVTRGAMTNTLQRLQVLGYITVRPDPRDGRGKRVSITDAGRNAHAQAVAAMTPDLRTMEQHLDPVMFSEALPTLEAVRAYLDRARNPD